MIERCLFCRLSSAGEHELNCPNHPNNQKSLRDNFLGALKFNANPFARKEFDMVTEYIELISAYFLTVDLLESAENLLGKEKLLKVQRFVLRQIKQVVDEINTIEENYEDEADEQDC